MAIPSKVQEKRQAFTEKIIDDIRSGKPFFGIPVLSSTRPEISLQT